MKTTVETLGYEVMLLLLWSPSASSTQSLSSKSAQSCHSEELAVDSPCPEAGVSLVDAAHAQTCYRPGPRRIIILAFEFSSLPHLTALVIPAGCNGLRDQPAALVVPCTRGASAQEPAQWLPGQWPIHLHRCTTKRCHQPGAALSVACLCQEGERWRLACVPRHAHLMVITMKVSVACSVVKPSLGPAKIIMDLQRNSCVPCEHMHQGHENALAAAGPNSTGWFC